MQPLKKRSTTIHEDTRRMLAISRDAYAFCAYVHYRCADSRQKRAGWCCDNKQELADFVGLTRPGLYKMGERLVEIGLLEMSSFGDYRATPKWVDADAKCKQSLQNSDEENVNKVYKKCKQSLQNSGENVNKVYNDTYILELENKREKVEEKTTPPPSKNLSLEAEKETPPQVAPAPPAAPTRLTIHDPETPGAKIIDIIPGEPQTQPPKPRIELGDRATAETPTQLETALRNFYQDWPNEWSVGVLENGRGGRYGQEKRTQIVKDFCCWAVENNRQRDTFRQLNASLQKWFRNEEHATWKQKTAPGQATTQTPDQNFYRRNPIK